MKRVKVLSFILVAFLIIGINMNVYASEVYYTTPNGIDLTEEEYKFITVFYGEQYLKIMTEDQYKEFVDADLLTKRVTIKKVDLYPNQFGISPQSNTHSTPEKTLQIGSACSSMCYTSILLRWHASPNIRSYDVIGAYFHNVSLIDHNTTYVYSTAGTEYYNNLKTTSKGIGNTVKLPDKGDDIVVNMMFTNTKNGTIFGSYQHAMQNTTLLVSQNYEFSLNGHGNVFLFTGNAVDVYDEMTGVDVDV